jgi:hypothetical protein
MGEVSSETPSVSSSAKDESASSQPRIKLEFGEFQCLVCGCATSRNDDDEAGGVRPGHVPVDQVLLCSQRSVRDFLVEYSVVSSRMVAWDGSGGGYVCRECFSLLNESDSLSVKFEASIRAVKERHCRSYGVEGDDSREEKPSAGEFLKTQYLLTSPVSTCQFKIEGFDLPRMT